MVSGGHCLAVGMSVSCLGKVNLWCFTGLFRKGKIIRKSYIYMSGCSSIYSFCVAEREEVVAKISSVASDTACYLGS